MIPEVAALDRAIARVGQPITITRTTGSLPNQVMLSLECRAIVRAYKTEQLIGTITQGDSNVILSPTDIMRAQWPGGQMPTTTTDTRIPKTTDKVVFLGRTCSIIAVKPLYIRGELARIDLQVRG
ncbi:hypothetical protein [Magnetospirillum sp. 15-1]|uniref:hypothetical protein n=1 Tax=Magnetospirillum sp. 15-1 TaxID=1979370 RepID=UPI000BBC97B1|nr:hypothetical protein [Magnetospirillum sp. 15-1]